MEKPYLFLQGFLLVTVVKIWLDPDLRPEYALASHQPSETEQASSKQPKRAGFRDYWRRRWRWRWSRTGAGDSCLA